MGSFWYSIKDYKLNNSWMIFPKEKVYTDTIMQYREYPVDNEGFFGAMSIPANRWVHLAITYDQELKVIRTWIDGGIDRTRYLALEGEAPVLSNPEKALGFMKGMKNVRVAGIRLSRGVRKIGPLPVMESYVQQLPYQGKVAVIIDHIDRKISLPVEIVVLWKSPAARAKR